MTVPSVTVVIPTKDRPELLARAVDSVLAQTHASLELIIVDDGSAQPVRISKDDDRIRVLRHERSRGPSAARNTGLARARGGWISFLDDDDRLDPSFLERSLAAMEAPTVPPPVGTLTGVLVVDSRDKPLTTRYPVSLPKGHNFYFHRGIPPGVHNTLLVPTEVLRKVGGWDEQMRSWIHTDLFLRLNLECSLQAIDEPLYGMTDHAGSRVHRNEAAAAAAMRRTIVKHRGMFEQHPSRFTHYQAAMAVHQLRAGDWMAAIRSSSAALWRSGFKARYVRPWLTALMGPTLYRSLAPRVHARSDSRPKSGGS